MLVQAVEKFKAAGLELNLQEIFIWYFEQKGVENVERFLGINTTQTPLGQGLPIPLLQAMAQNLQSKNTETELSNNVLQNVLTENKEVE